MAFEVGAHEYTWGDVVDYARRAGLWDVARVAASDPAAEGSSGPSQVEVDRTANEWRYARRLVAAEDLTRWLDAKDVTLDEWQRWVRHAVGAQIRPATDARMLVDDRAVWVHVVCSGELTNWTHSLAEGAAARAVLAQRGADVSLEEAAPRLGRLAVTSAAIAEAVQLHQLEWTTLACDWVVFATDSAAREALLCVRDDGETLARVALDTGRTFARRRSALDDLDPPVRAKLLSAAEGDLVAPVPDPDGQATVHVRSRTAPSSDEPADVERAERFLSRRAVQRAVEDEVRWRDG